VYDCNEEDITFQIVIVICAQIVLRCDKLEGSENNTLPVYCLSFGEDHPLSSQYGSRGISHW
jgi:hypothetical protein